MLQYKTLRNLGCSESKALEIIENYTHEEIDIIIRKLSNNQNAQQTVQQDQNSIEKIYAKGVELFRLKSPFTTKQLRTSYKQLSLQYHPDKCGTDKYFVEITKYYELLLQFVSDAKEADYSELKNAYNNYTNEEQSAAQSRGRVMSMENNGKFDLKAFNTFFQENKFSTEADNHGYGDWLKANETVQTNNIRQGVSSKDFNREFDKFKNQKPVESSMTKYSEPQMMVSKRGTVLGEGIIEDYSGSDKRLTYTDLKLAHNNNGFINPNQHQNLLEGRAQSIDQMDNHRSKISYTMNESDRAIYEVNRKKEENSEINRMIQMRQTDSQIAKHHNRVNNLLQRSPQN